MLTSLIVYAKNLKQSPHELVTVNTIRVPTWIVITIIIPFKWRGVRSFQIHSRLYT